MREEDRSDRGYGEKIRHGDRTVDQTEVKGGKGDQTRSGEERSDRGRGEERRSDKMRGGQWIRG